MDTFLMIIFGLSAAVLSSCSAGVLPAAVVSAPYVSAVPYNVPPHVSRIDISTKAISAPIFAAPSAPIVALAAPAHHAPLVAAPGPIYAGPLAHPAFTAYG